MTRREEGVVEEEEEEEVNTGLVHRGRTHPLGVITGPTCSVGPAKGVARTRSLIEEQLLTIHCVCACVCVCVCAV